MADRRVRRLNEQLKREISAVVRRDVRDPRVGIVTVTGVEVTPDLYQARVFVQPAGDGDPEETLVGLRAAEPHIRRQLGRSLHLRRIPELDFEIDTTLEEARRIEAILEEVRPEEGWGEEPDGEGGPGDGA